MGLLVIWFNFLTAVRAPLGPTSPETPIQLFREGKTYPNIQASFVVGNKEWGKHLDYLLSNHLAGRARNKGEFVPLTSFLRSTSS